jgi:hypothetical protein
MMLSSAAASRAGSAGHISFLASGLAWHLPRQGTNRYSAGQEQQGQKGEIKN